MNPMAEAAMRECTQASDAERITFAEVVDKLMAAGVERYHADLLRSEKVYYMPDGTWLALPNASVGAMPAGSFSAAGVEAAVRAIQSGAIKYREFCARIAGAGCVGYFVSLVGRCAVYYGRDGASHVEAFPVVS